MTELAYYKFRLDNWIGGMEISKTIAGEEEYPWADEDEEHLELLKGVRKFLDKVEEHT